MNHPIRILAVALLATAVTACNQPVQSSENAMANKAMPMKTTAAHGVGTITAIDHAAGKVTLSHGPVTELHWPAMTMSFTGTPAMLDKLAVGDKAAFSFEWNGKAGQLTSITKQ